ncbi:predicted protein [Histoplasma mississippiense (nom. inval.)]|nr:predicted protein [Histoplasma mississippiense (nom. inval.)]EDN06960.1 predicted protein [Histoplasma mississippiense (nom. inval.)]
MSDKPVSPIYRPAGGTIPPDLSIQARPLGLVNKFNNRDL